MVLAAIITILSISLLIYAVREFRQIGSILPGEGNKKIIGRVAVLLGLLLTTYLLFGLLFIFEFDFKNTNAVMSLLMLLSAIYLVIFTSFTVLFKKVSEKKLYEVENANKELLLINTKKKQLVSILAHELKTPIASISGFVQLLQRPGVKAKDRDEYHRIIIGDTARLDRLITNITDLAQVDMKTVQFDIVEVKPSEILDDLKDLCDVLAKSKGIETTYSIKGPDKAFRGDRTRLNHIMSNLFMNAVHYTPKKGKISVKVRPEGSNLLFIVRDNGCGIPKEHIPHIFELFYQGDSSARRSVGGTGLGLTICKGLIDAMGGQLWVKSDVDKGTSMQFSIPKNLKNR